MAIRRVNTANTLEYEQNGVFSPYHSYVVLLAVRLRDMYEKSSLCRRPSTVIQVNDPITFLQSI